MQGFLFKSLHAPQVKKFIDGLSLSVVKKEKMQNTLQKLNEEYAKLSAVDQKVMMNKVTQMLSNWGVTVKLAAKLKDQAAAFKLLAAANAITE